MRHILRQVNDFLNVFKKEVVIIDFHEFPDGFDKPEAYSGLEKLVNAMLGEFTGGLLTPVCVSVQILDSILNQYSKNSNISIIPRIICQAPKVDPVVA